MDAFITYCTRTFISNIHLIFLISMIKKIPILSNLFKKVPGCQAQPQTILVGLSYLYCQFIQPEWKNKGM